MKIKNYILFCFLFLFYCCVGLEDDEGEYFKFTQDDYNYIPTVYKEVGKVRHYVNQHNDTIKIENRSYTPEKRSAGGYFFGGTGSMFYYYDELCIKLRLIDFTPIKYINFEVFKRANTSLINSINIPTGRFCKAYYGWKIPEDKQVLTELTINNKTYKDVAILFEEPKEFNDGCYFFIADTVTPDKVYYSLKHGIIGFDDTKNNLIYRLKE